MTTGPSREHVEAVLKSLYDSCPECRGCGMVLDYEASMRSQQPEPMQCERCAYLSAGLNPRAGEDVKAVEYVLTSTDPALLAALQDTLVRAGWLTEQRHPALPGRGDHGETLRPRRFVTEWQEDQP